MGGGWRHTVAVTSRGAYAWGWNKFGQLGIGTADENPCVPHKLASFAHSDDPIEHITAGWKHTMFVTATGAVFATGRGNNGQLCMPVKADLCAPCAHALSSWDLHLCVSGSRRAYLLLPSDAKQMTKHEPMQDTTSRQLPSCTCSCHAPCNQNFV